MPHDINVIPSHNVRGHISRSDVAYFYRMQVNYLSEEISSNQFCSVLSFLAISCSTIELFALLTLRHLSHEESVTSVYKQDVSCNVLWMVFICITFIHYFCELGRCYLKAKCKQMLILQLCIRCQSPTGN